MGSIPLPRWRAQPRWAPSFAHQSTRSSVDLARRALPRRRRGLYHGGLPPSLHHDTGYTTSDSLLPRAQVRQIWRGSSSTGSPMAAARAPPRWPPSLPRPRWHAPPQRRVNHGGFPSSLVRRSTKSGMDPAGGLSHGGGRGLHHGELPLSLPWQRAPSWHAPPPDLGVHGEKGQIR